VGGALRRLWASGALALVSDRLHAPPVCCTGSASRTDVHPTPGMLMAQNALAAPEAAPCSTEDIKRLLETSL